MVGFVSAACDADDDNAADPSPPATIVNDAAGPLTLEGVLTLDGQPLEAVFLGARVIRDGLVGACQLEIPRVTQGRYEIDVASDAQVRGCGAPGAEVLLWTFVDDGYLFSTETAPWPDESSVVAFDGEFSSEAPDGASEPVTEFKGHLFAADGAALPAGTVVEASTSGREAAMNILADLCVEEVGRARFKDNYRRRPEPQVTDRPEWRVRRRAERVSPEAARRTFDEIEARFTDRCVREEAERCARCNLSL